MGHKVHPYGFRLGVSRTWNAKWYSDKDYTDLLDITTHPSFTADPNGRPGTFGNGTKSQKIDYILLSPALFAKVTSGGVFRKGVWGGKNGTLFPHYDTMTKPVQQASDHAAVFADIAI